MAQEKVSYDVLNYTYAPIMDEESTIQAKMDLDIRLIWYGKSKCNKRPPPMQLDAPDLADDVRIAKEQL